MSLHILKGMISPKTRQFSVTINDIIYYLPFQSSFFEFVKSSMERAIESSGLMRLSLRTLNPDDQVDESVYIDGDYQDKNILKIIGLEFEIQKGTNTLHYSRSSGKDVGSFEINLKEREIVYSSLTTITNCVGKISIRHKTLEDAFGTYFAGVFTEGFDVIKKVENDTAGLYVTSKVTGCGLHKFPLRERSFVDILELYLSNIKEGYEKCGRFTFARNKYSISPDDWIEFDQPEPHIFFITRMSHTRFCKAVRAEGLYSFYPNRGQGTITINMKDRTVFLRKNVRLETENCCSGNFTPVDAFEKYFANIFEGLTVYNLDDNDNIIE